MAKRCFKAGRRLGRAAAAVLLLAPVSVPLPAFGQDAVRGQTVFERVRPAFTPRGWEAGGFRVLPALTVSESYDDNILAVADDPEDDFITVVTPSVSIQSDWANHLLGVNAFGQITRFAENTDENTEEGGVEAFGRLDITARNALSGSALYRRETESRTDPEEGGEDEPSQLDRYLGRLNYQHEINRFRFLVDAQVQRLDFVTPGDHERDRWESRVAPRIAYAVTPNFSPFVEVTYGLQDYDGPDSGGVERDSRGVGVFGGVDVNLTTVLKGEAFVGYFRTSFDEPALDPVSGFGGGAALTWYATDLTSVQVTASRGAEQTTRASASSKVRTLGQVRVEHELLRNVLLDGEVLYFREDFQGIDRIDDTWGLQVGGNYLLNRYLSVALRYEYLERDSDVNGADFKKNVVLLSTRLQF